MGPKLHAHSKHEFYVLGMSLESCQLRLWGVWPPPPQGLRQGHPASHCQQGGDGGCFK